MRCPLYDHCQVRAESDKLAVRFCKKWVEAVDKEITRPQLLFLPSVSPFGELARIAREKT
jgi:hypothetical protein